MTDSTTRHTPGPWIVLAHKDDGEFARPETFADRDDAGVRADELCFNGYYDAKAIPLTVAFESPDLLRVLEGVTYEIEEYGLRDHAGEWIQKPGTGREDIDNAIRRARGES